MTSWYPWYEHHHLCLSVCLQVFAVKYYNDNIGGVVRSEDSGFVLSYAIMMLNTDLHSPHVRRHMSSNQWIKMNKGMSPCLSVCHHVCLCVAISVCACHKFFPEYYQIVKGFITKDVFAYGRSIEFWRHHKLSLNYNFPSFKVMQYGIYVYVIVCCQATTVVKIFQKIFCCKYTSVYRRYMGCNDVVLFLMVAMTPGAIQTWSGSPQ